MTISLGDFFLGGRTLGFIVLLMTLYATQYSGNTLIGFPASAYRNGFNFLASVTFMMGVIGVYLLYAPKLYKISREAELVTLSDYIHLRFKSRKLAVLISLSGIVALANFLVTNLKAMGETAEQVTGCALGYNEGIVLLAVVIIIYETLGGLRSVAWTDVLQGVMLFIGCFVVFAVVIFVGAVIAAIMSTADSALLTMASSVVEDLVLPIFSKVDEGKLTVIGKLCSWFIMGIAVILAIVLPQSIWALVQIKVELLIQIAPALLLGIHAGLWGLVANVITLALVQRSK